MLSENAINARSRVYKGPKKIKYGMAINGEGVWKHVGDCRYHDNEHDIILDDMIYIFHRNVVEQGAFEKFPVSTNREHEWLHTNLFNERKIQLNVIGIHLSLTKYHAISGDINM